MSVDLRRLNEADPHQVWTLAQHNFESAANWAWTQILRLGFAYVHLSPGDGTTYVFSIIRPTSQREFQYCLAMPERQPTFGDRLFVASTFGTLYEWSGQIGDWTYVLEKFTTGCRSTDEWTARVIYRFLDTLADVRRERPTLTE